MSQLLRNKDFLKFWGGDAISDLGNQVTMLALPLTAIAVLGASPAELGILGAAQFAPFLVFGLIAGVWIDRVRLRPLMIAADVTRAACIGLVPLLAAMDMLTVEILYVVAFVFGTLTLLFDVASQSYLPALVEADQLSEANAKLQSTGTVAQVAGPAVGGLIVQILSAPTALVVDAISFLASALGLSAIKRREPKVVRERDGATVWQDMGEGLRFVVHHPLLRVIASGTAVSNFFGRILFTVYLLFLTKDLGLGAGVIGLTFAAGSLGSVLGAVISEKVGVRFGIGRAIVWSLVLGNAALLVVPAVNQLRDFAVPILIVGMFVWGFSNPIYNVSQVSLRQSITPARLLGRMNASMRFLVWGTVPIGYLAGGALGETIGLVPTMVIGAVGGVLPALWMVPSQVRALKEIPSVEPETVSA